MKFKVLLSLTDNDSSRAPAPRWGALQVPRTLECEELKFIAFWEYDPTDMKQLIDKFTKSKTGLEVLFEPHGIGGQHKGFTIFEADNIDEIINYIVYYTPELDFKIYPIIKSADSAKKWLESQK